MKIEDPNTTQFVRDGGGLDQNFAAQVSPFARRGMGLDSTNLTCMLDASYA